jgi:hypothetical protein
MEHLHGFLLYEKLIDPATSNNPELQTQLLRQCEQEFRRWREEKERWTLELEQLRMLIRLTRTVLQPFAQGTETRLDFHRLVELYHRLKDSRAETSTCPRADHGRPHPPVE